ncbi:hypothetical protein PDE_01753 [Penicillium oxalicum 114-2]|uniref:Zn(2)-C6 fungal-type domain-containing protein n=1 Tax=Penicillium oxalicum (strain 114-2 / CGMCC 5302) TaxID=933388 RepID=S7Z9C6_PENO1|nr:hypothetical protein PDE_01753 [Penicillium oxalicum 114-2]
MASAGIADASFQNAEKSASSCTSSAAVQANERSNKPRSCTICRSRKVRCDKQSPCSNCRRANIACTLPSRDRPPRWARRLAQSAPADVMDRIQSLEALVKDLRGQLEEANARVNGCPGASSSVHSSEHSTGEQMGSPSARSDHAPSPVGRLVLRDSNQSRYIGNSFWSRITDELNDLRAVTEGTTGCGERESSDEEGPGLSGWPSSTRETEERSPQDRNAFVLRHNLMPCTTNLGCFRPLPSQIPFLINVFSENINFIMQAVHEPSVAKMIRDLRGDLTTLTPATEALMFSIYYGAVASMEEEDVLTNFQLPKAELSRQYRLGLETALAKADFLSAPNLLLVQALVNFLALVRRHDSPQFVWMMVGLAIRMAISLGLHRDGTHFPGLCPFEIEMRRRVWWGLCMLDVRASEDQGTEFTIALDSFDTQIPANINNQDIQPDSTEMPPTHDGLTDMSLARVFFKMTEWSKRMVANGPRSPSLEEKERMLQKMYREMDEGILRHSAENSISYWTVITVGRLMIAKMTLFIYLPSLFSSSRDDLSVQVRTKLLIAAVEVAEYNHALNAERACRQWRWIFQTYTHWHAIVYILIEISRRPWCPLVERAWTALHSIWLIPSQSNMRKNMRVWFPLRKLMQHAHLHRAAEIERLKSDPLAVESLQREYADTPIPSSDPVFSSTSPPADTPLQCWKQMLHPSSVGAGLISESAADTEAPAIFTEEPFKTSQVDTTMAGDTRHWQENRPRAPDSAAFSTMNCAQLFDPGNFPFESIIPDHSSVLEHLDMGVFGGDCDLETGIDWYSWVQSAQGMEWDSYSKATDQEPRSV